MTVTSTWARVSARSRCCGPWHFQLEAHGDPLGPTLEDTFHRAQKKLLAKGLPAAEEDAWRKVARGSTKSEKFLDNYFGWPGYLLQGALLAGSFELPAE